MTDEDFIKFGGYSSKSFSFKDDLRIIRDLAAKSIISTLPLTVKQSLSVSHNTLSLGCTTLDSHLRGGFPSRQLIEIVGEAGSGKTQLCLQLILESLTSKNSEGAPHMALFLSTEGNFPSKRWNQIISAHSELKGSNIEELNKNLKVNKIYSLDQMITVITEDLEKIVSTSPVKLVVIDSIASFLRTEFDLNESVKRAQTIFTLAKSLKKIASIYNIHIVCVNQVSDVMTDSPHYNTPFSTSGRLVIPALGPSWSNCVNFRLALKRTNKKYREVGQESEHILREMDIMFSSYLPRESFNFIIEQSGIRGVYG